MSFIILKFDDLDTKTLPYFQNLHEYCRKEFVPVCFGLIGESLRDPSKEYVSALLKMQEEGAELWNHGYWHTEKEFSSCTFYQQMESIKATQVLMEKHLGEAAYTFGSPHNNSTEITVKVLRENFPEIRNYFYMVDREGLTTARQLLMRCNYEVTTGVVDIVFFRREYERIREYPYFVMQGHPSFWSEEDLENFKAILKILKDDGNEFVTTKQLESKNIGGYSVPSKNEMIQSLESFFITHDRIFFYGSGEIGREVYRFMNPRGFSPDAFVVSDGYRTFPDICGTPVLELSELKAYEGKCGIVPTVLSKLHEQIFTGSEIEKYAIWTPGDREKYDRFVDLVRYGISCQSMEHIMGDR